MIAAFRLRKLMFFVLAFAGSMYLLREIDGQHKLLLALLFLVLSAVVIAYHFLSAPWKRLPLLALLPITLGIVGGQVLSYGYFDVHCATIIANAGQTATITASVEAVSLEEAYASVYTVRVTALDGKAADFPVVLELPFGYDAAENDILSLPVTFSLPEEESYGFEARSYYASRGIYLIATAEEDAQITYYGQEKSLTARLRKLSSSLEAKLQHALGKEAGGLASGLLLGRRQAIGEAVKRDFRFLGISHTLAVSGLHLSILVGGLLFLLRSMELPQIPVFFLATAFILGYIALTGGSPSIVRSGIMLMMLLIGQMGSRSYDPPTGLATAVLVILLFSPGAVIDPGFLLSASATAGLIALGVPMSKRIFERFHKAKLPLRLLSGLLSSLVITLSAMLFTLPFVWLYFKELAPIALFSNLLFLPLIRCYLFLSVLTLLLYETALLGVTSRVTSWVGGAILDASSLLTRFASEPISLRYSFVPIAFLFGLGALLLLLLLKKNRFVSLFLSALVTVAVFGVGYITHLASLRYEDTVIAATLGNNDYLLLHSGGRTILCDFSDGSYSKLSGAASLSERYCYDTSVDSLLLTHLHRRHITSFARLADNIRLRQLILPSPQGEEEYAFAQALIEKAKERGIEIILYSSEEDAVLLFDDCRLRIAPLTYLDRSVQPMHLLTIEGEETFTYVGSASPEWLLPSAYEGGFLWLGTHGPNIKKPLALSLDPMTVFVSSEEVNEGYGSDYEVIDGYCKVIPLS